MKVPLIPEENVRTKRPNSKPYQYYAMAISEHLPWLKEQIKNSKDGYIYIRYEDMAKVLDHNIGFTAICWGLKFVLFEEGIIVDGRQVNGSKILAMRFGNEDDSLPRSLAKLSLKEY